MEDSGTKGGRTRRSTARTAATAPAKTPAKTPAKVAAPRKAPAARPPAATKAPVQPAESFDREEMVRVAAYFRAERRGFAPGYEVADWLAAQAEVDVRLGAPKTPRSRKTPAKKQPAG